MCAKHVLQAVTAVCCSLPEFQTSLASSICVFCFLTYSFPLQAHPGMETPLDVLSRAASLVHADDEKRESPVFSTSCAKLKLPASPPGFVTVSW